MKIRLPDRCSIDHDAPIRLTVAAAIAFPDGSMTASGLRREGARGRLVIERIAGKDFTTLRFIERMREICRTSMEEHGGQNGKCDQLYSLKDQSEKVRLVCRDQAAAYCCLSPSAFSNWVKIGRLPSALAGTSRWDLKAIDLALDALSGLEVTKSPEAEETALDKWRTKRARRSEGNS